MTKRGNTICTILILQQQAIGAVMVILGKKKVILRVGVVGRKRSSKNEFRGGIKNGNSVKNKSKE
jgi:hypothetical protein